MSDDYQQIVSQCLERLGRHIVMGLPLGLGKPNRLINAFYRRACEDPSIQLDIVTALSLNPPKPGSDLEARFLNPFLARHFGEDYPRLEYADALAANALPDNVRVSEFYFQSGGMLGNATAQRHYISSNYTHVARDLVDRGINLTLQLVATREGSNGTEYSLSSNPDVTLDLVEELKHHPERDRLMLAQVHPELPFMEGDAVVEEDFFHQIIKQDPEQPLFALPRGAVDTRDYCVGLNASALIADGGTLQIGIGSLSDALVDGLIRRQHHNDDYRAYFEQPIPGQSALDRVGGFDRFEQGLYGASEMFLDAFMHLYQAGLLSREVFDDETLQQLANDGQLQAQAPEQVGKGALMDGAFFLGSKDFYHWLRELDADERPRFRMSSVGRINQLYGGNERLETLQRQKARFVNTCMMMSLTGAATSDGLKDHQLVSGVGGQYNFVAMAHAMRDGRSVLMLRSVRESKGETRSNIVWEYPHVTIPRHLRDIVVTEYGVADLRGRTDEECIQALLAITDSRFQDKLRQQAVEAGKLNPDWRIPDKARANNHAGLIHRLRQAGWPEAFPDYPAGSDFTPVEQRLVAALQRLKGIRHSRLALVKAVLKGGVRDAEALERMNLATPSGLGERLYARLLCWALNEART